MVRESTLNKYLLIMGIRWSNEIEYLDHSYKNLICHITNIKSGTVFNPLLHQFLIPFPIILWITSVCKKPGGWEPCWQLIIMKSNPKYSIPWLCWYHLWDLFWLLRCLSYQENLQQLGLLLIEISHRRYRITGMVKRWRQRNNIQMNWLLW